MLFPFDCSSQVISLHLSQVAFHSLPCCFLESILIAFVTKHTRQEQENGEGNLVAGCVGRQPGGGEAPPLERGRCEQARCRRVSSAQHLGPMSKNYHFSLIS